MDGRQFSATLGIAVACLMPINAGAAWLENFYDSAGAAVNITPGRAISNQHVSGYSGSSVVWRVPTKQINPFQITPPSIKAGCSGIDWFMGSYSFVNKDALVQALRNFGQAAVGYFFMLALRSMAPEIAVTLEWVNQLAQKINSQAIGGCNDAMKAAQKVGDMLEWSTQHQAARYEAARGNVADTFDGIGKFFGVEGFGSSVRTTRLKNNHEQPVEGNQGKNKVVEANTMWWAIRNSNLGAQFGEEDINFVMSLFGTCDIVRMADNEQGMVTDSKGPQLTIAQLIGSPDSPTGPLNVTECAGDPECLRTIDRVVHERTFAGMSMNLMERIRDSIIARAPVAFTPRERAVLGLSSVPMYRIAALAATNVGVAGGMGKSMMETAAMVSGTDAAINMIDYYAREIDKFLATAKEKNGLSKELETVCRAQVAEVRRSAYQTANHIYEKTVGKNPLTFLRQIEAIERYAMGSLNHSLAANARFGKRF